MYSRIAAGVMAIAVATLAGGAGVATAISSPGGTASEHLRIMSTKATSHRLSVIATGDFTAGGYDIPGRVTDTLVFPGGTLKFLHFTHSTKASFNISTCLGTETQAGTFKIGHGTGKYAGIHGSGKFVGSLVFVTEKNHAGQCTHVQTPATFQAITTAGGSATR